MKLSEMKTKILFAIAATIALAAGTAMAQDDKARNDWQDRMKAHKIAFLTDRMELTSDEASVFWPVYNKAEQERKEAFTEMISCYKALHEDGMMVNQHESPFYEQDAYAMQRAHKRIVESFPVSQVYQAHIPTYPSGHWLFGFAAKKRLPVEGVDFKAWKALGLKTRYYNTQLHAGAFALPNYVEDLLKDVEP